MARPAKPKPLTKPVAELPVADWVPFDQVFLQVQAKVGSAGLAVSDMHRALHKGRLKSAVRSVKECVLLRPAFWLSHRLHHQRDPVGVRVWPTNSRSPIPPGWVFFAYRPDFEKLYPPSAQGTPSLSASSKRGAPTVYDWHAIDGEIAARCIDAGKLKVWKNEAALSREIALWCQKTFGHEPADSKLREAVRAICKALRAKQK